MGKGRTTGARRGQGKRPASGKPSSSSKKYRSARSASPESAGTFARTSPRFFEENRADGHDEALEALLLHTLRQANRPLDMDAVLRISKLPRKNKKRVEAALFSLQGKGLALRGGTGWSSPTRLRHVEGRLSVQRSGVGFVTPTGGSAGQDIYIHPAALNGAWHGDFVEVLVLPGRRGPSAEGRITKVLERGEKEIAALALRIQADGRWLCAPANPRMQTLFITDVSGLEKDVSEEDLLLLRPGGQVGPNLWEAEATVNLEREETPAAQEMLVKSKYEIPGPFPQAVLAAAALFPQDPEEADFAGRHDLRSAVFVTIDGRRARDFDDAIEVSKLPQGYRLRVAIADVSHYVGSGSPLDDEARLRGNSYYFPLSVEPMLPEALSNGLCSLKPGVPRLAMVAELRFSFDGERRKADFYSAVIESKARITYGQIERGLLLEEEEDRRTLAPVLPMLLEAEQLARNIMAGRKKRGSLDFDIPEAEACFNEQGELVGLSPRKRHFGHRLIEEFMIAANEAVAEYLQQQGEPTLYRVHQPPDPDKLRALFDFISASGLGGPGLQGDSGRKRGVRKAPGPSELARLLDEVRGSAQEYTVNRLLLRAMMQARYEPDNEGHFGLASDCYCHFTSPIRRYADLVTHRALKHALGLKSPEREGEKALTRSRLSAIAEHINETERTAAEAEREIDRRLGVLLLRDRVGEVFEGVISGLTDFGLFVELPSVMVEGLVRLATLTDDYYQYIAEKQEVRGAGTGRVFRLGQSVTVQLTDVHIARLEVNLVFAGMNGQPGTKAKARKGAEKAGREKSRKRQHRR